MSLPINIKLPDGFLKAEVRCGYEISEKHKKIWAIELDLLAQLFNVCKKHKISVQVFAGTLLGAVRHKGMIPWDDDIDVAMTREEFNRLCKIAPNEFKAPYFFQTALNDQKFFFGFARLRNSLTTGIIKGNESADYNNGIYIDIFPLDGVTNSKICKLIQNCAMKMLVKCCTTYIRNHRKNNSLVEFVSRAAKPLLRIFPYKFWVAGYTKALTFWNKSAKIVGLRTHFNFGDRYCMRKEDLEDTVSMRFEFIEVPVPRKYKEVLCGIYGDYMKFPNLDERGKWHEGQIIFEPNIPYQTYIRERGLGC